MNRSPCRGSRRKAEGRGRGHPQQHGGQTESPLPFALSLRPLQELNPSRDTLGAEWCGSSPHLSVLAVSSKSLFHLALRTVLWGPSGWWTAGALSKRKVSSPIDRKQGDECVSGCGKVRMYEYPAWASSETLERMLDLTWQCGTWP